MLVQVTIGNFLSFREEITFSMVGGSSDLRHADHFVVEAAGKGLSLLPISAIYGANAAGKSNLIKAIDFAKKLITEGTRSSQAIPVSYFKLGDYSNKPSKFDFIFAYGGALYSYGFTLNTSQIIEEWLYVTPSGKTREIMYFERVTSEKKETTVEYGTPLKQRSEKRKLFLDFIAQGTRPNQLFLTEALERNVQTVKPVDDWFRKILVIIPAEVRAKGIELGILSDKDFTGFLKDFLRFADTGIASIEAEEVEFDFKRLFPDVPDEIIQEVREDFIQNLQNSIYAAEEAGEDFAMTFESSRGNRYLLTKGIRGKLNVIQLRTQHRHKDGHLVNFLMEEESDGTQRLINLMPALFLLQDNQEKVILLDEFDRQLHPLLSRRFIEIALNCKKPNSRNQIIFTTHDTNLLDLELLRKDEIWFVEKNQEGASHLYSLAEFKIRSDLKIEKGYLNGRFGAIPFFGDIRNLGWLDCETEPSKKTDSKNEKAQPNKTTRSPVQ